MIRRWRQAKPGQEPSLSIVVAVYNKARDLELCLEGYSHQSFLNFELILADDGSNPDIEALVKRHAQSAPYPITYLWQEDKGWGKPRMLNWAALEARAERLVFTDGDCIPHRHFARAHHQESSSDTASCGRRVDLFDKVSAEMTIEKVKTGALESPLWLLNKAVSHEIDFGQQGIYLPYIMARTLTAFYRAPRLLGSNMGVHKQKLLEVNGFDESFNVAGVGEDTDMQRRFEMAGLKVKWITYRAVQYHLWHNLTTVGEQAHKIYEDLKSKNNMNAIKGIREFQPEWESYRRPSNS
ncbi:MAG: hypothetical protein A2901_01985 [Elusimicrobia bacterium RIFCSPLOWO2_01_FULL_54_10]|nr:MAG: hypothetical protein A2901_01985 [Elusimicrobia bacterium RIFCSPLOWO2_01_FULL_54_10]